MTWMFHQCFILYRDDLLELLMKRAKVNKLGKFLIYFIMFLRPNLSEKCTDRICPEQTNYQLCCN